MGYIDEDELVKKFDTLPEGGLSVTISLAEYRFLTRQVTTLALDNDRLRSEGYKASTERDNAIKAAAAANAGVDAQIEAMNRMNKLLELHHGLLFDPVVGAYVSKNKPVHTGQSVLRSVSQTEIEERRRRQTCGEALPQSQEEDEQ